MSLSKTPNASAPPAELDAASPPTESGKAHFGFVWNYTDDVLEQRAKMATRANNAMQTWYGSDPPTFIMAYLKDSHALTSKFRARLNTWFQQNENPVLSDKRAQDILIDSAAKTIVHTTGHMRDLALSLQALLSSASVTEETELRFLELAKEARHDRLVREDAEAARKLQHELNLKQIRETAHIKPTSSAYPSLGEFEMSI